ncbi:MAG: GNAT family N-acetyltransferase [Actinomycetota bacterium]
MRPEDRDAVLAFLGGLSVESLWLRFFSGAANVERAAAWIVEVDYRDRYGLVATTGDRIVGHGAYQRTDDARAEIAFAVADEMQGKGLGTILLGHLAEAAASSGISTFEAEVLPENHKMVEVFRESGFPVRLSSKPGTICVEFPASLSSEALERFEGRERTAAGAALKAFFFPRSVAVIGASRSRGTIGGEVFHNLLVAGFNGPVYPVNPKAEVVQSVAAYHSINDVPGSVDIAVIAVPA